MVKVKAHHSSLRAPVEGEADKDGPGGYSALLILGFDTATVRASVAIGGLEGPPLAASLGASARHASGLLPTIRERLQEFGAKPTDLGLIAVGLGPGSFTGLRVGLAAAKGLAFALGIPLVGLDTLDAIALGAGDMTGTIRVAVDSRRGELFVADYEPRGPNEFPRRLSPTRPEPTDAWLASLRPGDLPIGPALDKPALHALLPLFVPGLDPALNSPRPASLLELARLAFRENRSDDPATIEPIYIRASAAEERLPAS